MIQLNENLGFLQLTETQINESLKVNNGLLIVPNVLLSTADEENGNGRIYPKMILESAIDKYMERVRFGNAYGECDHDEDAEVKLKTTSHRIKDIKWVGNKVYGDFQILDTDDFPCGKIVGGFIRHRLPIGVSSRSLGTVKTENGRTIVESLEISCYDFVSNPSNHNSFAMLKESKNFDFSKFKKANDLMNQILLR
jgi:hypothetical protein